jgi:transcription elongation factor Elf1
LGVAEVFAKEQEECKKSMDAIDWKYKTLEECIGFATCPECGSPLVRTDEVGKYRPSLEVKCASCGASFEAANVIESCLEAMALV